MGLRRALDRALDAVERKVVSTVDKVVGEDLSPVEEEYRLLVGDEEPRPVLRSLAEMAAEDFRRGLEERRRMSPEEIEEEEFDDIYYNPAYKHLLCNAWHHIGNRD